MKGIAEMTNTKDRVTDASANVRPYIERALRDEELRQNVKTAYTSARSLYDKLLAKSDVSDIAVGLASDQDVQTELKKVVDELREAAGRVQAVRGRDSEPAPAGRNGLLLVAGVLLGLFFNPFTGPPLRRWVGKKLFGGGSSFVYRDNNGTPLS
jgi:hypothetical protein